MVCIWGERGIEYDDSYRAIIDAPNEAVIALLRLLPTLPSDETLAVAASVSAGANLWGSRDSVVTHRCLATVSSA